MIVEETSLPGVLLITPRLFEDERGTFSETWNGRAFSESGIGTQFVQDNHSLSKQKGTVRGLHFQAPPHAQAKLVRCTRGSIFDVTVDIRRGAPTYGNWLGVELGNGNRHQLFIPEGFLHGFITLEDNCEVEYKCSAYYAPDCEGAVRWDSCGISWPQTGAETVLSEKDAKAIDFADFATPFEFRGR
ncbi:dTDP-4-dehydrorhamnose 3,5-epimerase [Roseibium sp. MMSF_3544]|uniref:dTDP-4-dehydrorhamnose 3,5-epimerase n=1 Tax=unclassified Roseibium TaxID=2629323 RepID=UPI00273E5261|nr:dTDP-4-dehydrorhamnose 3,5-epimerase [Roseibium sp. MMSF_3544]